MTISHQIRHIRELNSWKTRFHQRKHHVDRICASDCGPHLLKNLTLIFSVSVSELNLDNISQVYCPLYHTIIHVWYRRNTPDVKHKVVIKWWILIDPRICFFSLVKAWFAIWHSMECAQKEHDRKQYSLTVKNVLLCCFFIITIGACIFEQTYHRKKER
jgi:hypothetical protein